MRKVAYKNDKILDTLKNSKKSYADLQKEIGDGVDIRYNICHLLNEEKIRITGIKTGQKSFSNKIIMFERTEPDRRNPNVVLKLIKGLYNNKSELETELKMLFEKKLNEIEELQIKQWEDKLRNVHARPLSDYELAYFSAYNNVYTSLLEVLPEDENSLFFNDMVEKETRDILFDDEYLNDLSEKYSSYRFWEVKGCGTITKIHKNIFEEGKMDKNKFLALNDINYPEKLSAKEKRDLYNKLIFYIKNFMDSNDDFVKQLAIGLSDMEESFKNFESVLNKIPKELF